MTRGETTKCRGNFRALAERPLFVSYALGAFGRKICDAAKRDASDCVIRHPVPCSLLHLDTDADRADIGSSSDEAGAFQRYYVDNRGLRSGDREQVGER